MSNIIQNWKSGFPPIKSVTSLAFTILGNNNIIQLAHHQTLEASSLFINGKACQPQLHNIAWILHSTYIATTRATASIIYCEQYCNHDLTGLPAFILHPTIYYLQLPREIFKSKQNKHLVKFPGGLALHIGTKWTPSLAQLMATHFLELMS